MTFDISPGVFCQLQRVCCRGNTSGEIEPATVALDTRSALFLCVWFLCVCLAKGGHLKIDTDPAAGNPNTAVWSPGIIREERREKTNSSVIDTRWSIGHQI